MTDSLFAVVTKVSVKKDLPEAPLHYAIGKKNPPEGFLPRADVANRYFFPVISKVFSG
jgi:hypothetical protein